MTDSAKTDTDSPLLVGVANPKTIPRLMRLAADLALETGRKIVVTNVVTVPSQISLVSAKSSPEVGQATELLRKAIRAVADRKVPARGVVEVAREPHEGMIAAAESQKADVLLVGYSDETPGVSRAEKAFDRVMHRVASSANSDLLVAKFRGDEVTRILVPVAGGAVNLRLTGPLAQALARSRSASVEFLHVAAGGADPSTAEQEINTLLEQQGIKGLGPLKVIQAEDPIGEILRLAADYDLVIVGTDVRPSIAEAIFGNPAEHIAAHAPCSVFMVRAVRETG